MDRLTIRLGNVHCNDCALAIKEGLATLFKINQEGGDFINFPSDSDLSTEEAIAPSVLPNVSFLLSDTSVILAGRSGVIAAREKDVVHVLEEKGFDVLSTDLETETDVRQSSAWDPITHVWQRARNKVGENRRHKVHLASCAVCQAEKKKANEEAQASSRHSIFKKVFISSSSDSDQETVRVSDNVSGFEVVVASEVEYRAVIAIEGMTCIGCSNSVTEVIQRVLDTLGPQHKSELSPVSFLTKTAVIIIPNKQIINTIISAIRDSGYTATLLELLPIERSKKYKVTAVIGGMTCAACSSAIQEAVKDLPFIAESAINIVSKSGMFIIDSNTKQSLEALKDKVEDVGYEFDLIKVEEISHAAKKNTSRTVNLEIEGMFCEHCPEEINNYLARFGESVVIDDPITLAHPYVKFTYVPAPPALTIRKLLKEIDEISPNFKVKVIKAVSLDEHLRKMAHRDSFKIIKRIILSVIVAIPTFIIGIVCMSLLPKHHHIRMWFMEPIWAGNVSRAVWALFILSTPIYIFADDVFHRKALIEIKNLWKPNVPWKRRFFKFGSMNLLMSLGTTVAYFASIALLILSAVSERRSEGYSTTYFDSVVFLTFFLLIGRFLEAYSKSKTADAVTKLGNMKPPTAHLVERISNEGEDPEFGNDEEVKMELLEVGDYVRVAVGESPVADSIIVKGESQFDESALTGESAAVTHGVGQQVFSGTVNTGSNAVVCEITALDGSSLIDAIVSAVRDSQLKRAPIERTADTLTGIFVPIICALASLTWFIWLGLGYGGRLPQSYLDVDIGGWCVWSLEFSIACFVVACPCGIGLAAPTALYVGSGLAAKYGILAKGGGAAFQEGAKVDVACFDKTGTLTLGGDPQITDFAVLNEKEDEVVQAMAFQVARDIESFSRHPLAIAVKNFAISHAQKSGIKLARNRVPEVEEIPGKGLKGNIFTEKDDGTVWHKYGPTMALAGNEKLLSQHNSEELTELQQQTLSKWKEEGKSVVLVAVICPQLFRTEKCVPVMMMAARDQIRPEAKSIITRLQKQNISCWMISGDNRITANAIAKQLGITNVVAEVLPEEKSAKIEWIQKTFFCDNSKSGKSRRAIVAMIGDGINDAPALAAADVGVALASGSDLALTSSDFVLLAPKYPLISLLNLFSLSKAVLQRVRFNFGWALVYNSIGIPIAAGVIYPYQNSRLNPVWASAAMAASSISVVLSSLALKFYRSPKIDIQDIELERKEAQRVFC